MIVDLSEQAAQQIQEIDTWWRRNRLSARDLFSRELASAIAALEHSSGIGTSYETGTQSVRRLLLQRTHYHLYFVEDANRVVVIAVWSAFRGRGPL